MLIGLFAGLVSGAIYTIYIVLLNNYIDTEHSSKIILHKEQANSLTGSELSSQDVSDLTKIMLMSSAMRGAICTLVCMTFGIINSIVETFMAKKNNYKAQN